MIKFIEKMYQHLQYQISFIKLSIDYVFIVHLFELIDRYKYIFFKKY